VVFSIFSSSAFSLFCALKLLSDKVQQYNTIKSSICQVISKRIEYVAKSSAFSRRRTARLLIVAHEHGILANNFYVFPTYSYIVASSEQPHTFRPAEYDNCNYLARASVNFNIRHGAEYISVPLIYNLLVSQIRHAAVQKNHPQRHYMPLEVRRITRRSFLFSGVL
jgi:hypothetical protein